MITFERFKVEAGGRYCDGTGCRTVFAGGDIAVSEIDDKILCYCSCECLAKDYNPSHLSQTPAQLQALFEPDIIKMTISEISILEYLKQNEDVKFEDLSPEHQAVLTEAGRSNVLWLSDVDHQWKELNLPANSNLFHEHVYKLKPDYYPGGSEVSGIETQILKGQTMIMYRASIVKKNEDGKATDFAVTPKNIFAKTKAAAGIKMAALHPAAALREDNSICVEAVTLIEVASELA